MKSTIQQFMILVLLAVAKIQPSSAQGLRSRSSRKVQTEDHELLDQKIAEMNEGFNNIELKLMEWPSELQETLGSMTNQFLMTLPKVVEDGGKMPLLIDLHGGGSRWWKKSLLERLETAEEQGMKRGYDILELWGKQTMLGLHPQTGYRWEKNSLDNMLDFVLENFPTIDPSFPEIDPNRVYVMGYSAGGGATWRWINQSGDRFAAASPNGFRGQDGEDDEDQTRYLPIWAAAGSEDGKNPGGITRMGERLELAGNEDVVVEIFDGLDHREGGVATYSQVELLDWMLEFQLPRNSTA